MSGRHDRIEPGARSRSGPGGVPASGSRDSAAPLPDRTWPGPANDGDTAPMEAVARRTPTGWRVGDEEVPDLTSAMVLADLLAAELAAEDAAEAAGDGQPASLSSQASPRDAAMRNAGSIDGPYGTAAHPAGSGVRPAGGPGDYTARAGADGRTAGSRRGAHRAGSRSRPGAPASAELAEAEQLKETVAQLERALTVRVRVEQAIGVLAERHKIRPRQAFELLRSASRSRGQRIMETASQVIASATNPLLRLPEELAKPPMPRRMPRRRGTEA